MSWNPLRKISRHGSKSHLLQGEEGLLEKHVCKLEQLENSTKKLYKDAKKYEDVILQSSECEKKMTNDLSNSILCQEEEQLRILLEEWHSFIAQAAPVDEDLALVTRRTVIDPLKKFQGVFSEARAAIKRREQSLQECNKCSQKVQKLQEKEKTGQNIVKLEAAKQNLMSSEEEFRAQDNILRTELPQLYEGRIEFFQPCLEALIKSQVEHSGDTARVFSQTVTSLSEFTLAESDYRQLQNQRLSRIQGLSIVADK